MGQELTLGERFTLQRWLRRSLTSQDITQEFFEAAWEFLNTMVVEPGSKCRVQNRVLYNSFTYPSSTQPPGLFWHEVEKVLEHPIFSVYRNNDLWKVGDKVWVRVGNNQFGRRGVVEKLWDLGCEVFLPSHGCKQYYADEFLTHREEGDWNPFEAL